ncbi:MAG: T9SS type A sorting domain-containing protein [Ignavibacteriaceae bacterium]|nr:T9SS type A sorting domain-containing protein [Ignavibacteriaceae bacterium]
MKTLVNETKSVGSYEIVLDASELPSGTYFYTLIAGNYSATKKVILLK